MLRNMCQPVTTLKCIYFISIGIVLLLPVEGTVDQQPACEGSGPVVTTEGYGVISSHEDNYPSQVTCNQTITANNVYDQIYLIFEEIDLDSSNCNTDYISVTDGSGTLLGTLCDDSDDNSEFNATGSLTISLTVGNHNTEYDGYEAVYTLYRTESDSCNDGEFRCDGDKCIDKSVRCSGYHNCEDKTDEKDCKDDGGFNYGGIIGASVGVSVALISAGVCGCKRYHQKRACKLTGGTGTTQSNAVSNEKGDMPMA